MDDQFPALTGFVAPDHYLAEQVHGIGLVVEFAGLRLDVPDRLFAGKDLHHRPCQGDAVVSRVVVHGVGLQAVLQASRLVHHLKLHAPDEDVRTMR